VKVHKVNGIVPQLHFRSSHLSSFINYCSSSNEGRRIPVNNIKIFRSLNYEFGEFVHNGTFHFNQLGLKCVARLDRFYERW